MVNIRKTKAVEGKACDSVVSEPRLNAGVLAMQEERLFAKNVMDIVGIRGNQ